MYKILMSIVALDICVKTSHSGYIVKKFLLFVLFLLTLAPFVIVRA